MSNESPLPELEYPLAFDAVGAVGSRISPPTSGRSATGWQPRPVGIDWKGAAAVRQASRKRVLARIAQVAILAGTDTGALLLAGVVGFLLWARPVYNHSATSYWALLPFLGLYLLGYAKADLYPGFGIGAVETIRRLTMRTGFVSIVLAASSFVFHFRSDISRMAMAITLAASLLLVPLARFIVLGVASRQMWWGEPTVVVGTGEMARRTVRLLRHALSLGYRPVALVSTGKGTGLHDVEGVPVIGGLEAVPTLTKRGMRIALLADFDDPHHDRSVMDYLHEHFPQLVLIREYDDVRVEGIVARNLGGVMGLEYQNLLLCPRNRFFKRGVDVVLGGLGLLLAAPLIALAALAVKLASPGPSFYAQPREGRGGKIIKVWKLRTMYVDAETRLEQYLQATPSAKQEWEERFKLASDPRIIPFVGKWMRRLSIDELPQLWNVIRGEMSLVGPRPFPEYHLRKFDREFRALRRQVPPGLSGLWQVMVRSDGGVREQQAYDTYYIRNWSIWMDIYVLAKTASAVLKGRGAC